MAKIIGIDLGATNSVVAVTEGSSPKILVNASGSRLTPSVVGFTEKGERLVGRIAKHQQVTNPENTIFSIKRFMGRRHNEVAAEEKIVPYKITGGPNELVKVNVRGKEYTPPEISAMILQDIKKTVEDYLGEKVTNAVITVPAYFNDSQRRATKDAAKIAGLEVERIINEPTAAALAYGLEKKKNEKVAVFDFGGGTFDISILDISNNVFEVLSTNGDTHLGGDDLDAVLINYLADEFKKTEGIDLRQDPMAHQRLKEAAEKAKCELSTQVESTVNLPFITADASGPKHLQITISRSKFESLVEPIFERLKTPCRKAIDDAKLKAGDIAEVLLVGGSTRIPKVQQIVKSIFGKEPNMSINPDEVVAVGAAIQGAVLAGDVGVKDILLLDVTPLSLGVETLGGVMTKLIERNTTIPASKKEVFSTGVDSQTAVDIHILQGEREFARDNRTLGRFQLTDIPPAPRGIPQIEVAFDIDANGILNVSAKNLETGKEQSIEIKSSPALSEEEMSRMVRAAESHGEPVAQGAPYQTVGQSSSSERPKDKSELSKRWWQFWKRGRSTAGRIFVCGYFVTPGSQLHRRAVEILGLGMDQKLEEDVNVEFPDAEVIDRLVCEWTVHGHGVVTEEQRQAMHCREKEIGQALYDLGGIDLMEQVALKLIHAGRAYESDFFYWGGIGGWQI